MKIRTSHSIALIALLLAACSPVVYEAPHASQGRYYSYQAPVVIHHDHRYTRQHRHRIEQELLHRHTRSAPIYQGRGRHGDLIEVSIRGGHLYHQGRRIKYDPVSFRIARGDIIRLPASGLEIDLFIRYDHGRLAMDTDIFGRYAYTLVTIDANHDFGQRRAYRLHNDHIRDAQFTVAAVSHDNKHRPDNANKNVNKPVPHGNAAGTGKIRAIHERALKENWPHEQGNEPNKRFQSGNRETAANPGPVFQKNKGSQHNRPERKDQKVSKQEDPRADKPERMTKTRDLETTDRGKLVSRTPAPKAEIRPPVVKNRTPQLQKTRTAAQTDKLKPREEKEPNERPSYGKNVGKANKMESLREKVGSKENGKRRDNGKNSDEDKSDQGKSEDSDKRKDGDKGQSIDRTEGDKTFVQKQGLLRSRLADSAAAKRR